MTPVLLALLFAAPERVVLVAKEAKPPGFFEKLQKQLGRAARRLYERDDDDVVKGNALLAQGEAQGALAEYDKARARLPDDPGVAYDRATALLQVDANKMAADAASEASRALQRGDASLKPRAAYQLALAMESMGQADDALRQYGAALALDPDDVDSKVNLELLLKTQEQSRRNPAGQPRESQPAQQGAQQKPFPQKGEAQRNDQQSVPQKQPQGQEQQPQQDAASPQQSAAQDQDKQQRQPADPKAGTDKPVDRTEAQRLLDALRASEKNLQIWRFAKKKTDLRKRSDLEKDW